MLKKSEDFNETRCHTCGQLVPLNKEGKIVTHFYKLRDARKGHCAGSGKQVKQ